MATTVTVTHVTPLIKIETNEYPRFLSDVHNDFPNVSISATPSESRIKTMGYAVVHQTTRPQGDVVIEGAPVKVDGKYEQTWTVRAFSEAEVNERLEARKKVLQDQIIELREADLASGFTYELDAETKFGVQLRPGDRTNLVGLSVTAGDLITMGSTTTMPFRSTENVTYQLTPTQFKAMCMAALGAFTAIMQAGWVLNDQVEQAQTFDELPEIPATLKG